jgi:hypothetical protein
MSARLSDREIEQLLTRSPLARDDLSDLEGFVAVLSSEQPAPGDLSPMASSLAAVARSTGRPMRQPLRRLSLATALVFVLMLFSGIALAADGSGPGNPLYRIDQALEKIGIGAGGDDERLEEFQHLLEKGSSTQALEFLEDVIGVGVTREDVLDAASASNAPADVQQKVADLHEFITGNRGKDQGLDGADFGQGVAEIARSNGTESSAHPTGPPDHAGETGPPDHAGVPGPPDHAAVNDKGSDEEDGEEATEDGSQTSDPADSESLTPHESTPASPAHAGETGPPDHAGETGPPDQAGPKTKP